MKMCISGPAPEGVTNAIYELTTKITSYKICTDLQPVIDQIKMTEYDVDGHKFTVDIIDSVSDYAAYMREIFDFDAIKNLLSGGNGQPRFQVLMNAMHGG